MRKVTVWTVLGILLISGLMACGSAQGGNCDAYSSIDSNSNSELAAK